MSECVSFMSVPKSPTNPHTFSPQTAQPVPVAASVAASDADVDECEETEEDTLNPKP